MSQVDDLIKIANYIGSSSESSDIFKIASEALREASRLLEEKNSENNELKHRLRMIEQQKQLDIKSKKVNDIIELMLQTSTIKNSEIEDKKQELLQAEDNVLDMIQDTLSKVAKNTSNDECLDDVAFIYNNNKHENKNNTLYDSVNNFFKT